MMASVSAAGVLTVGGTTTSCYEDPLRRVYFQTRNITYDDSLFDLELSTTAGATSMAWASSTGTATVVVGADIIGTGHRRGYTKSREKGEANFLVEVVM